MPFAESPRVAVIFNPVKVDEKAFRSQVVAASRRAGWGRPRFYPTEVADPGAGQAKAALKHSPAGVIVAGGDGTVRIVAGVLAGTGIPLTIVPSGTGNLFARNIGLVLNNPEAAIDCAFSGTPHPIDLGWARITHTDGAQSDHPFVVLAGIGLDASMIAHTRDELKKTMGWVAYVEAAARALPKAKAIRALFQVDKGRIHSTKVQSMLFANCGSLPAGISLIPTASITDGRLDVVVFQPRGIFGWLRVGRKIWWDNSVLLKSETGRRVLRRRPTNSAVRYLRGVSIDTAVAAPTPTEVDGDEVGDAVRIQCRVDQGALSIMMPPGHNTDQL